MAQKPTPAKALPTYSAAEAVPGLRTLAIDVGGTGLKAAVLNARGQMVVPRVWVATPYPCPPDIMVTTLVALVRDLPGYDRISIGFPGFVRRGRVLTAPHFGTSLWSGFTLEDHLAEALGKPARLLNDAEMQGYGVVAGEGIELVLTLGTGAGTALFRDGALAPHIELAHHPVHKSLTYNEYVGKEALAKLGKKRWNRRVLRVIDILQALVMYDQLYIGGGNAQHVVATLPPRICLVSNDAGLTGGIALWRDKPG